MHGYFLELAFFFLNGKFSEKKIFTKYLLSVKFETINRIKKIWANKIKANFAMTTKQTAWLMRRHTTATTPKLDLFYLNHFLGQQTKQTKQTDQECNE